MAEELTAAKVQEIVENAVDRSMKPRDEQVRRLTDSMDRLNEMVSRVNGEQTAQASRLAEGAQRFAEMDRRWDGLDCRVKALEIAGAVERWKLAAIVGLVTLLGGSLMAGIVALIVRLLPATGA